MYASKKTYKIKRIFTFLYFLIFISGSCFADTGIIKIQSTGRFYCPEYAFAADLDVTLSPPCQRFVSFPTSVKITNNTSKAASGSITFFEQPPMNSFITVYFTFDENGNFQYEKILCESENRVRLPCTWERNGMFLKIGH